MIVEDLISLAKPIGTLRTMPGNPRKGDIDAVARSYERFGQRKPIVATRDGTVIAGNHQLLAARKLGWQKIAVVFVDDDDITSKAFALADNHTADLGAYDNELLAELISDVLVDSELLQATSYTEKDLDELIKQLDIAAESIESAQSENPYSTNINAPQYEIVGDKPDTTELYDDEKTAQLHDAIRNADIPTDVRNFLTLAAFRHTVFNYRKIAEFYPHQSKEIQRLMEDSALVIIDLNDAMKNGFIRMSETLKALRAADQNA